MAKENFTATRVDKFTCPPEKDQVFLWDSDTPRLGLRATRAGAKAYFFQGKLNGVTMRITIGAPKTWTLAQARTKAKELSLMVDKGRDPRHVIASELADEKTARDEKADREKADQIEAERISLTFGEAWTAYLESRKDYWSVGHYNDHVALALKGGTSKKRGKGIVIAGPLSALLPIKLCDLTCEVVINWLDQESERRPSSAALAFRLLRAFVGWMNESQHYKGIVQAEVCTSRKVRSSVPKAGTKHGDCLQQEQLPEWFEAVRRIDNPVASAYLQALLITGARRREMAALRWQDVDFTWRSMIIRDKVEGTRQIPLPPYLAKLLAALPKHNQWVFSALRAKGGQITEPRYAHKAALAETTLPHLSIHGLRRSFGTLCGWVEMPSGVAAQIMGHKPSALAEKHYIRRPLDMLRKWHDEIERWMLERAGIQITPKIPVLRVVNSVSI